MLALADNACSRNITMKKDRRSPERHSAINLHLIKERLDNGKLVLCGLGQELRGTAWLLSLKCEHLLKDIDLSMG